jgi:hypothetical protein
MTVHHIGELITSTLYSVVLIELPVLFKMKPNTTKEQISELESAVEGMVGHIPGW